MFLTLTINNIPGQLGLKGSLRPLRISPTHVLHQDLSTLQFQEKLTLLQYVDDLLLCSVTKEAFIKGSIYWLQQTSEERHKVCKEKFQLSLDSLHYLGHDINCLLKDLS